MPIANPHGKRRESGVLDALEAMDGRDGQQVLDLASDDLVELAGDQAGGIDLLLLRGAPALVEVAPELRRGYHEKWQQHRQHEHGELRPDRQAHEGAQQCAGSKLV